MNPDLFLEPNTLEKTTLISALVPFYTDICNTSEQRNALLTNASIDESIRSRINGAYNPQQYTETLVSTLAGHKVSDRRQDYHPLVKLLEYILTNYSDYFETRQTYEFLQGLCERGQENLRAIRARAAVGQIEGPDHKPIGSGVLISPDLLLTCFHIFTKQGRIQVASVTFGYYDVKIPKPRSIPLQIPFDNGEYNFVAQDRDLDYALIRLDNPKSSNNKIHRATPPNRMLLKSQITPILLNTGYSIHLVHYPGSQAAQINEGNITDIAQANKLIYHNAGGEEGSSGGAIFDDNWKLIAIHRGHTGFRSTELGALPLECAWTRIGRWVD